MAHKPEPKKIVLRNRKARFDYEVDETLEVGLVLTGSEVKSLRAGNGSLVDAFVHIRGGELFLVGAKIDPYLFANLNNHEPMRDRKILAHRQEIKRLITKVREKGYTIIPLEIYVKDGKLKAEIGLARGKKQYEKRDNERAKEARKEMDGE